MRLSLRLASLAIVTPALAISFAGVSCNSSPAVPVQDASAPPPPQPPVCKSSFASATEEAVAQADVGVYLDATDPVLDPVASDLASYLGASWGAPVTVSRTTPDFTKQRTIWLSTSDAAAAKAGASITSGYAIERVSGTGGSSSIVVYAKDATDLATGAYALLETLGIRFFHPKQEIVPQRTSPVLPLSLDVKRAPFVAQRGLQFHTLHPIEYLAVFNEPSDANLADAKKVIDWLVKTGQNYVQWALLSTVSYSTFAPYAQSIIAYAHSRGVNVGCVVQLWAGAAVQNNYDLVTDATSWQTEMDSQLSQLMTVPWDVVEIGLGEFKTTDPSDVVTWLSHATSQLATTNPSVQVNAQNHVGDYPQMWVPYDGQTVFYYQLPQFSDSRLGQTVHTLYYFDLYRDWGMYAHPDFHLQHDYLLQELAPPASRRVNYFPESAYWVTADDSVPAFLPEYIVARSIDIQGLAGDIAAKGLPPMNGHVMFTSGHEWNYWMTDYMTAKMLWDPTVTVDELFSDYAVSYGECASDVARILSEFTALQTKYLFDERLAPYVMGEDKTVDLGYLAQIYTIPRRVQFEDVVAMSAADRAAFTTSVVAEIEAMAAQVQPLEDAMAVRCPTTDAPLAPFCNELWDGIAIVRLRLQHTAQLYRSILAYAAGDMTTAQADYANAQTTTTAAAAVVTKREAGYRFDLARLTTDYANPTIYPFGYLREAHTQCYFHRREDQVASFLQTAQAADAFSIESCDN